METADTIEGRTGVIDELVKGSTYAEPVKEQTDGIRTDTEGLRDQAKRVGELERENQRLRDQAQKESLRAKEEQRTLLNRVAVGALILSGVFLYFKLTELAGISALVSITALGWVRLLEISLVPWLIGFVSVGGILWLLWSGRKTQTEKETGDIVFQTLETVYSESDDEHRNWMNTEIFTRLSSKMDHKHKRIIQKKNLG